MMPSWLKIGQKVVLVCEYPRFGGTYPSCFPEMDKVYTIADVRPFTGNSGRVVIGLALTELTTNDYFASRAFRPVYPEIIDRLRTLPLLTPERVREDA